MDMFGQYEVIFPSFDLFYCSDNILVTILLVSMSQQFIGFFASGTIATSKAWLARLQEIMTKLTTRSLLTT